MNTYTAILEAVKAHNIEKAVKMLEANIIEDNTKKASKGNGAGSDIARLKIIQSYLKKAGANQAMQKAHRQKSGRYLFTEGHIAFLNDHDFGIDNAEDYETFHLDYLLQYLDKSDYIDIDIADIKSFIALTGATRSNRGGKNRAYYMQSKNGLVIAFNPFFALDAIKYADTIRFYVSAANKPIFAENGTCFFLPIYLPKNFDYATWRTNTFGAAAAADAAAV